MAESQVNVAGVQTTNGSNSTAFASLEVVHGSRRAHASPGATVNYGVTIVATAAQVQAQAAAAANTLQSSAAGALGSTLAATVPGVSVAPSGTVYVVRINMLPGVDRMRNSCGQDARVLDPGLGRGLRPSREGDLSTNYGAGG